LIDGHKILSPKEEQSFKVSENDMLRINFLPKAETENDP
jgi:hypothetical protein